MRKSKLATAETRKAIVATAGRLFVSRGLEATSVSDVTTAAGLTPGGFYRHFDSKEQLIAEATAGSFQRLIAILGAKAQGKEPRSAIAAIVNTYFSQLGSASTDGLCPLPNLGAELSRCDQAVRHATFAGYEAMVSLVDEHLAKIKPRVSGPLSRAIVAILVGAVSLARLAESKAAARKIFAGAETAIDAICG